MSAELQLTNLRKSFGSVPAVRDVSFTVDAGSALALVGPSGCGKSTILRIVAGLERPDGGRVRIGTREVTSLPPGKRNVGMVFQTPAAFPYLTVAENLEFGMKVRRVSGRERVRRVGDMADLLGLSAALQRFPAQLSGGERQRVELGRALLREPDVLLLDEPLSSLDAHLRLEMRDELVRIKRELGTTTIVVTHDQVEAMVLGDRVGVMRDGDIVQLDTPAGIYERPAHEFVARFIGAPPMNLVRARVVAGKARLGDLEVAVGLQNREWVLLGLRPADLAVATEAANETFRIVVDDISDQGPDLVVTGRLRTQEGGSEPDVVLSLRVPRGQPLSPGEYLQLHARQWHVFDPTTGSRISR